LAVRDGSGRVVDFHALRHTFITRLTRSGVAPAVAKSLVRHSTIVLTMDHYSHTLIEDERAALDRLPNINAPRDNVAALATTGTRSASASCQPQGQENPHHLAPPLQASPVTSSRSSVLAFARPRLLARGVVMAFRHIRSKKLSLPKCGRYFSIAAESGRTSSRNQPLSPVKHTRSTAKSRSSLSSITNRSSG